VFKLWTSCLLQRRIKGLGVPGQYSLEGSYDVIHDVIACKISVFADLERSDLLFPVVWFAFSSSACRIKSIVSRL